MDKAINVAHKLGIAANTAMCGELVICMDGLSHYLSGEPEMKGTPSLA